MFEQLAQTTNKVSLRLSTDHPSQSIQINNETNVNIKIVTRH